MQAENGMPENEDVKKKALLRLAVAGVVTAAALGGLWWLDQSDSKKPPVAEAPPAPIVSAPPPEVAAPQTEVLETEPEAPLAEDSPDVSPEAGMEKPATTERGQLKAPPPPPKVSNNPLPPRAQPSPQPAFPSQMAPRPAALTPTVPSAPPAAEPLPQGVSGKGYVVQLGVFSNPDNARELVTKLNKQGIRAHMEARVQLGPFLNRQEAEKAQIEMRKLGYNALLTLPYSVTPSSVSPATK
jgi:DedD protein